MAVARRAIRPLGHSATGDARLGRVGTTAAASGRAVDTSPVRSTSSERTYVVHNVYILYSMLRRFIQFVKLRRSIIKDHMVPVDYNSAIDDVYLS